MDFVLVDLNMPLLDGWETARLIKTNPIYRYIPVVAMSAKMSNTDRLRAFDVGCEGAMEKPINFRKLYDLIEQLTNKDKGAVALG